MVRIHNIQPTIHTPNIPPVTAPLMIKGLPVHSWDETKKEFNLPHKTNLRDSHYIVFPPLDEVGNCTGAFWSDDEYSRQHSFFIDRHHPPEEDREGLVQRAIDKHSSENVWLFKGEEDMPGGENMIHVLWRILPGTPIVTRREPDGTETVLIRW